MSAYAWTVAWAEKLNSLKAGSIEIVAKESTSSTNADAKADANSDADSASPAPVRLYLANHQTSGRGRGDNSWSDLSGKALLSSWVFQLPSAPQPGMSALMGLALFEAASKTWPDLPWALKAPNDLHVVRASPRKIAGLLIEVISSSGRSDGATCTMIVGLGLNVSEAPLGTKPYPATSLAEELATAGVELTEASWQSFLSAWVSSLNQFLSQGLVPELKQSTRQQLAVALARHPEYRDIKEVKANGSIAFNGGREVSWFNL